MQPIRKVRTYSCVALIAAVLLTAAPAGAASRDDDDAERVGAWLDAHVPALMREGPVPGFAIAVVRDDRTVLARGYGARDLERNLPVTPHTLFGIGSITKSFVAISVLRLVERGLLDLDDPVADHVPLALGRPDEPIRIRHLLTHTPGFPNLATSTVLISRGLGRETGVPMSSAADFFRYLNGAADTVEFAPGERFFYNNAAWRVLGAVIQARAGRPFHEVVTAEVLRPLGMERSTFDVAAMEADPDHLTPYRHRGGRPEATGFPYPNPADNPDFSFLSAAGGITSSADEMTRYLRALLADGAHAGGRLLTRAHARAMRSAQTSRPDGDYGPRSYGYGLVIEPDFLGHTLVRHGGSISVSTAHLAFVPEAGIGVVTMANSGRMAHDVVAESVLALLLGEEPEAVVPRLAVRERMEAFEGRYAIHGALHTVEVRARDGMLHLHRDGDDVGRPLVPTTADYTGATFHLLDEGRRTAVEFRGGPRPASVIVGRYVYRREPGAATP